MKRPAYFLALGVLLLGVLFPQNKGQNMRKSQLRHGKSLLPPYDWPMALPEDQGLDSGIFHTAFKAGAKLPFLYSVLIIRNGYLIGEHYYHNFCAESDFYAASVSKSFISALVGLALQEGYLQSVDQKMMDFFPDYVVSGMDPRKFDITIAHLLTMTSGLPFDSTDSHWEAMYAAPSMMRMSVGLPLGADPGERWAYSTSSTHILSGILTRAAGMSTKAFAERYLFEPLDISVRYWAQDVEGYYHGGWNMFFTPRDMARFGYLYLRGGKLEGVRILPEEWIRTSITTQTPTFWDWTPVKDSGYGYLWWLGRIKDFDVYYANGHGGQNIFCLPDLDMVIVTTTDGFVSYEESGPQIIDTLHFINDYIILPSEGKLGPPPYPPAAVHVERMTNRSLSQEEHLNIIRWADNPMNSGLDLTGVSIYEMRGRRRYLVARLDAGVHEFWHRSLDGSKNCTYALSSLAGEREGGLTLISSE